MNVNTINPDPNNSEQLYIINVNTINPYSNNSEQLSIINNNTCMARKKSDLNSRCSRKKKLNCDFCALHLKSIHVIRIDEDIPKIKCKKLIDYKNLKETNFNIKKYKYGDILYSLKQYTLDNLKNKKKNFETLHTYLVDIYNKNKIYYDNIEKIHMISKIYRGYYIRKIYHLRGPGFFKRHLINNINDFLNFTNINNIPNHKLITYKDASGFIYGFHIQSLLDYINEVDVTNIRNPYTRENFSKEFIDNVYILDNYNKKFHILENKVYTKPSNYFSPKLKVKRLCVSIFQRMDDLELYTQASWFLDLNLFQLKKLYFLIEDIWHYRASLTPILKKQFVNNGIAFNWPRLFIKKIIDKIKIQNILLKEFEKFVYQGKTKSDCVTASYWILMGLASVSLSAAAGCPALVQSIH